MLGGHAVTNSDTRRRRRGPRYAPLKTYESFMKIADELMHGPSGNLYRDTNWNRICLDNEWDVRTQERLSANCYQSDSWWRRWLGQ